MSYTAKRTKSKFVRRKMQACRQRLGLTCQQVADKSYITREYYIKIENSGEGTRQNGTVTSGEGAPVRVTALMVVT